MKATTKGVTKYMVSGSSRPRWRYRLFSGRDENGKQLWEGVGGFTKESEAVAAMETRIEKIKAEHGTIAPPVGITVAQWLALWLDETAARNARTRRWPAIGLWRPTSRRRPRRRR